MRNRVKLLLVFSCVLWIACSLFCRTQTIDASSKIPGRYNFTKICDLQPYFEPYYYGINNEGTVAMYLIDRYHYPYDFLLSTGNGRVFTELIKNGDIVFSEWQIEGLRKICFIYDKGLTWLAMSMYKVQDKNTYDWGVY